MFFTRFLYSLRPNNCYVSLHFFRDFSVRTRTAPGSAYFPSLTWCRLLPAFLFSPNLSIFTRAPHLPPLLHGGRACRAACPLYRVQRRQFWPAPNNSPLFPTLPLHARGLLGRPSWPSFALALAPFCPGLALLWRSFFILRPLVPLPPLAAVPALVGASLCCSVFGLPCFPRWRVGCTCFGPSHRFRCASGFVVLLRFFCCLGPF